jgi:hypothetical protein
MANMLKDIRENRLTQLILPEADIGN